MNITFNTWGLNSINNNTFNIRPNSSYTYPQEVRDVVYTAMKVTFTALDILGYIPGVSLVSGITRMAIGVGFCAVTLAYGDRHATEGVIIQHWYDEAIATGVAQIARGALEAFVPYGWAFNATLDIGGTIANAVQYFNRMSQSDYDPDYDYGYGGPHPDPF